MAHAWIAHRSDLTGCFDDIQGGYSSKSDAVQNALDDSEFDNYKGDEKIAAENGEWGEESFQARREPVEDLMRGNNEDGGEK